MKCGLLGRKLGHSYSPEIHGFLAKYAYDLFEVEPENLESFLKTGDFNGLNVTIPYKKAVIPYLDELSPIAQRLGAVNTIVRRSDGRLVGHNSDYFGFQSMLEHYGVDPAGKKALVLGSGGASATVVAVLEEMGAKVTVISRSGENNYENICRHYDAELIVNTTPVGMYPGNGETPLSLEGFDKLEAVLDIIYNPTRTRLLIEAEQRGIKIGNGLWMLVAQAAESSQWFTGNQLVTCFIGDAYSIIRKEMRNFVLIGMPGCGKSTIGKIFAQYLELEFVDTDEEIEALTGLSIPEIFATQGEEGFRALETQVLERLGKESGRVIATGGGCVTREENYPLLHQNSVILWIQRDVHKLPTDGRPLSIAHTPAELYARREPMYRRFCDFEIDNNGSLNDAMAAIMSLEEYEP